MKQLKDRVAVVTGAGSGIGRATALALAKRGCHLAITDLDVERLGPVAADIQATGRRVSTHGFDVSQRDAWSGFVEDLLAAHGEVHLVMNNAGVVLTGPFLECSLEDLEWQLDVNLRGVLYGTHHLLPHLVAQDDAHLVNVSSIFGIVSVAEHTAYCMAKHAVKALTESLEQELYGTGVQVSSVHPGAVATRIVEDGRYREGGQISSRGARKAIEQGMAPEQAAEVIVKGILRNQRRILVGRDAHWLAGLQQAFPVRYRDLLRAWVQRRWGVRS